MLTTTTLAVCAALALGSSAGVTNASPAPAPPPIRAPSFPLHHNPREIARRSSPDYEVRQQWLKDQADFLTYRYGHPEQVAAANERRSKPHLLNNKRQSSSASQSAVTLTDIGYDASYSAPIQVGTPSQIFEVFVDTGSADLWIASNQCTSTTCEGITTLDTATSSSFKDLNQPFNITYGSGEAGGTLGQDTVTMGTFTVSSQTFGVVTQGSDQLLSNPVSGLMGFAWKALASSGATPFWQQLAQSGKWSTPAFAVRMARYRDVQTATQVETQGGSLDLGFLNSTSYTGSINYMNISSANEDYWRIPVNGMTVGGNSVSISSSSGSAPSAAIDTGTTLVAVPSSTASALYAQISGSRPLNLQGYEGYYEYPCSTDVSVALIFNGVSYSISNGDFNLGPFTSSSQYCTGAFYGQDLGSQSPISWIVGATFLKNVYSVYAYNPPAVGFAALSGAASSVQSATASQVSGGGAQQTGSSSGSSSSSSGAAAGPSVAAIGLVAMTALAGVVGTVASVAF